MQTFEHNRFKVSTTTNNYNDVGLNNLQVVKNAIHTLISDVQMQKMVTQKMRRVVEKMPMIST